MLVILVSAFQRLVLYEQAYGFTRARFYALIFMVWLGILFMAVIALVLKQYQRGFGIAILITCIGFSLSLNLMNVDATVASHNINRATTEEDLDIGYLSNLSDDAIPVIGNKFSDPNLSKDLHQQLGVALVCNQWTNEYRDPQHHWQSFNLSRWRAERMYQSLTDELSEYTRVEKPYTTGVQTPDGDFVSCYDEQPLPEEPPPPIPQEGEYNATPLYPDP